MSDCRYRGPVVMQKPDFVAYECNGRAAFTTELRPCDDDKAVYIPFGGGLCKVKR